MKSTERTYAERFTAREHASRFDRLRVAEAKDVPINEWARRCGLARSAFNKQRAENADPRSTAVSRMVRAATSILGRPVKASELYGLGEEEPLGSVRLMSNGRASISARSTDSRLGRTLARIGISALDLQSISGVTKATISRIANNKVAAHCSTVRRIVVALRRAGHDVSASDVADLGDDAARIGGRRKECG